MFNKAPWRGMALSVVLRNKVRNVNIGISIGEKKLDRWIPKCKVYSSVMIADYYLCSEQVNRGDIVLFLVHWHQWLLPRSCTGFSILCHWILTLHTKSNQDSYLQYVSMCVELYTCVYFVVFFTSMHLFNFCLISIIAYLLYLWCDTGRYQYPISHHGRWGQRIDHDAAPYPGSKLLSDVGQTPVGGVGALHSGSTQRYTHYTNLDTHRESCGSVMYCIIRCTWRGSTAPTISMCHKEKTRRMS